MAMFPPTIPHVFVRWLTDPGDTVYDPFSGRGTAPLEACLLGRRGAGSDANPLAVVLTGAKVDPSGRDALERRLDDLQERMQALDGWHEPEAVRVLFTQKTLGQLLWLRSELDVCRRTDRFLMAALLGILHANADSDGRPRGLTVAMPNTFAMAPDYVRRYIKKHALQPPEVDVVNALRRRIDHLQLPSDFPSRGRAWHQDISDQLRWPASLPAAKLVFTSPPYLEVMRYGKFNWIRLWLLGYTRQEVDDILFSSSSPSRYTAFISNVLSNVRPQLRNDGYLCLVVGDVRRGDSQLNVAELIKSECLPSTDLTLWGEVSDRIPTVHKVSRIWGENKGRATRRDRILVLAAPGAEPPGALERIAW